jgi:hypothetical protein
MAVRDIVVNALPPLPARPATSTATNGPDVISSTAV